MGRAISEQFLKDLKNGKLSELLELVHNDTTLIMELRGKSVAIYYRGGVLFNVTEGKNDYTVSFNSDYWSIYKKYDVLKENPTVTECITNIAFYKDQMDYHISHAKRTLEKQCQQQIVLENNVLGKVIPDESKNKSATTGDYYILDIEYAYNKKNSINARFDIVALNWPSLSPCRKNRNKLGISFIEVKLHL